MARETFGTIRQVIGDIASRKHRAAVSRTEERRPDQVEAPRAIYLRACEEIALEFASDGFRYFRSGPRFVHKGSPFSYEVSFQSSHYNVAGEHVALWLAGAVTSRVLKAWRAAQQRTYRSDDWVAGGLAHLLGTDLAFVQWDLADPIERPSAIADVKGFVREVVFGYFERFSSPAEIIAQLKKSKIPVFELASSIEFALCFGGREDAQAILDRFAGDRPDLVKEAGEKVFKFKAEGIPRLFFTAFVDQVAFAVVNYDLSWQSA